MMQNDKISRRKALQVGAGGLAGAIAAGWARPAMATVPIIRASHSPDPTARSGNPSVEVSQSNMGSTAIGDGTYEITGVLTIVNVTDESIPVTISEVKDIVEVRVGGSWVQLPTTVVTLPCQGQVIQHAGQTCSGPFKVLATIPTDAKGIRNVIEVKVVNRDKTFLYRIDVPISV